MTHVTTGTEQICRRSVTPVYDFLMNQPHLALQAESPRLSGF